MSDKKPYETVTTQGIVPSFDVNARDYITKLQEGGDFREVTRYHPIYKTLNSALKKYNKAYPTEQIEMPSVIIEGKTGDYSYGGFGDILIFDKEGLQTLAPKELEAIIVHELRHKAKLIYQPMQIPQYSQKAHANYVAPQVFDECKKAGLSPEEINMLLPSDKTDNKSMISADTLEWLKHPIDMIKANAKALNSDTKCAANINSINNSKEAVLSRMQYDFLGNERGDELDADSAAKKAGLASEIANALKKIVKHQPQETEWTSDHPVLDNRLFALGKKPDDKGQKR